MTYEIAMHVSALQDASALLAAILKNSEICSRFEASSQLEDLYEVYLIDFHVEDSDTKL